MRRLPLFLAVLLCGGAVSIALVQPRTSGADAAAGPVFSSQNPLTFDFVAVGATSAPQSLTVTNSGTAR